MVPSFHMPLCSAYPFINCCLPSPISCNSQRQRNTCGRRPTLALRSRQPSGLKLRWNRECARRAYFSSSNMNNIGVPSPPTKCGGVRRWEGQSKLMFAIRNDRVSEQKNVKDFKWKNFAYIYIRQASEWCTIVELYNVLLDCHGICISDEIECYLFLNVLLNL